MSARTGQIKDKQTSEKKQRRKRSEQRTGPVFIPIRPNLDVKPPIRTIQPDMDVPLGLVIAIIAIVVIVIIIVMIIIVGVVGKVWIAVPVVLRTTFVILLVVVLLFVASPVPGLAEVWRIRMALATLGVIWTTAVLLSLLLVALSFVFVAVLVLVAPIIIVVTPIVALAIVSVVVLAVAGVIVIVIAVAITRLVVRVALLVLAPIVFVASLIIVGVTIIAASRTESIAGGGNKREITRDLEGLIELVKEAGLES